MPRHFPSLAAPAVSLADQYSGAVMCLVLGVFHLCCQHYWAGPFWLCLGAGLGVRAWLRQRRLTNALLVGACLALAAALGWQALRTVPRVRVPRALQLLPSAQAGIRAVEACQTLTRAFAALL